MPTTIWNAGRLYTRSEDVVADMLTEQYSQRLQWTLERNITVVQIRGVSDFQSTNVVNNDEVIPYFVAPIYIEDENAGLKIDVHGQFVSWGSAYTMQQYVYAKVDGFDTKFRMGYIPMNGNAYWNSSRFHYFIPKLSRGLHTIEIWVHTDQGYTTLNTTNTLAELRVEEADHVNWKLNPLTSSPRMQGGT